MKRDVVGDHCVSQVEEHMERGVRHCCVSSRRKQLYSTYPCFLLSAYFVLVPDDIVCLDIIFLPTAVIPIHSLIQANIETRPNTKLMSLGFR